MKKTTTASKTASISIGFLPWLTAGAAAITAEDIAANPPTVEAKPGDKVVGEMDEEAKRLWAFYDKEVASFEKKVKELSGEDFFSLDDTSRKALVAEKFRLDILRDVFWAELRLRYKIVDGGVGIIKGFKVVQLAEKPAGFSRPLEIIVMGRIPF